MILSTSAVAVCCSSASASSRASRATSLSLLKARRVKARAQSASFRPQDAKGLKVRGGSREMDMVLQAAGATTLSTPSNELYAARAQGAVECADRGPGSA